LIQVIEGSRNDRVAHGLTHIIHEN
jgi:hypothetical protein